jgi:hypothetical protein
MNSLSPSSGKKYKPKQKTTRAITEFMDSVHRPEMLEDGKHSVTENSFRFISRVWEGDIYLLGILEGSSLSYNPGMRLALSRRPKRVDVFLFSPEGGTRSSFRDVVISSYLEFRTIDKSINPGIRSAIQHRQNPLESISRSAASEILVLTSAEKLKSSKEMDVQRNKWSENTRMPLCHLIGGPRTLCVNLSLIRVMVM